MEWIFHLHIILDATPLKENIRFELTYGGYENYEKYYEQVHSNGPIDEIENGKQRAITLFNEVFNYSETIQIIVILPQYSVGSRIQKYLFKNKFKIIDSLTTNSWDDYYGEYVTVLVIETEKINFRMLKTIDGICYQDFPRNSKLRIKNPLIFYNKQDNLILYIYDDRGCDIWADNLEKQKLIYEKYNSWILDYDKKNISKFYKSVI